MNRQPTYYCFVQNNERLSALVLQTIKQKDRAVQLYDNLIDQAPEDEIIIRFLNYGQTYEISMKNRLETFYIENFGPIPDYTIPVGETTFSTFIDGVHTGLIYNAQSMAFDREVLDQLNEGELGRDLFEFILAAEIGQQTFLNTVHTHYLHYFM